MFYFALCARHEKKYSTYRADEDRHNRAVFSGVPNPAKVMSAVHIAMGSLSFRMASPRAC